MIRNDSPRIDGSPARRPLSRLSGNSRASMSPRLEDDDHPEPFVLSGANTPILEHKSDRSESPNVSEGSSKSKPKVSRLGEPAPIDIGAPLTRQRSPLRGVTSTPSPLSARGDLPGGYFPFHEDPRDRVRRTHPFHSSGTRPRSSSPGAKDKDSGKDKGKEKYKPKLPPGKPTEKPSLMFHTGPQGGTAGPATDALLTSYLPSGIHAGSLPMGKYYPSNYERRQQKQQGLAVPKAHPVFNRSAPQVPLYQPSPKSGTPSSSSPSQDPATTTDSDAKRRLQQYQRDMIAQATLAARKVLGGSPGAAHNVSLPGIQIGNFPISAPATAKPMSPRLRPLGSPGPVTPMELEGGDGSYLNKGHASSPTPDRSGRSGRDVDCSRALAEERARTGTRSPAVTPAF